MFIYYVSMTNIPVFIFQNICLLVDRHYSHNTNFFQELDSGSVHSPFPCLHQYI